MNQKSYVLMGITRGDELMHSQSKPLATSHNREELEERARKMERERDKWLAEHENSIPWWQQSSIWDRFEVVECPADIASDTANVYHLGRGCVQS